MLNKIIAILLALAVSPAQTVLCKTVDNFRVQDQIGYSSLDSGPSAFAPSNSYSVDPQTQLDSYNQERINKLSEHLTRSGIDHHINIKTGYGCDANVCASVSYRIEGRIHTFEINQGGISQPGRPPQISPCMSCSMATPSPPYGADPNNYNQGPSPFAKSRYNSALRELENVKRRLSDLNMKQSSVRSRLLTKESALNSAVRNANLAMSSMKAAGARARQKKQEAQNSKIEAERLAAEKWRQEERKEQLGKDIAAAEDVFDDLMNEIDNELKDISDDKYKEYANNSFSRDQVDGHNSASADINDVSRINEGIELLDIDLMDMVTIDKPVDLDEVESLGLKTPKEHKEYKALHRTKRYSKEVRTQLAEEGKLTTTKESFLDLADALIEMADNAFFGGENTEGKDFLAKSAMMVDFALDFVPGASAINDGVKIALGKNPWTGEEISDLETGMLIGGFFAPAIISGSAKVVSKIAGRLSKSVLPGAKRLLKKIKGADAKLGGSKVPCVTRSNDCYVPGGPVDGLIESAKEIGLDISKGMDRYGNAAIGSITDDGVKTAAKRWGTLTDGRHQLFEHTVEYAKTQSSRMAGLESRAGLPSGTLTKAASDNPSEVAIAIKNMQSLADDIISNGAKKVEGQKVHYWKQSTTRPKEGIRVIEYNGKIQSVNPTSKKAWDKFNP